jgi:hypothetical protein
LKYFAVRSPLPRVRGATLEFFPVLVASLVVAVGESDASSACRCLVAAVGSPEAVADVIGGHAGRQRHCRLANRASVPVAVVPAAIGVAFLVVFLTREQVVNEGALPWCLRG